MGSPQYKDGASIAALELNNASGSLWHTGSRPVTYTVQYQPLAKCRHGCKSLCGEEHLAQDAQLHRETASWLQPSAAKKRRAPAVRV